MEFEIDVSGEDIFNRDYTICVAGKNREEIIKGFKFDGNLIQTIRANHADGKYRFTLSNQGKALLRVRIYCIVIYYIFKGFKLESNTKVNLTVCKDFQGHEKDINSYLNYFLKNLLSLQIEIKYKKLQKNSIADKYSYLMRKDTKDKMDSYVKINLEEIEKYLIK